MYSYHIIIRVVHSISTNCTSNVSSFFLLLYVHTIFNVCESMAVFDQNPVKFFSTRKVKREPNLISRLNSKERAKKKRRKEKNFGSGGIRTHAIEMTGA